jgi:hypothetical protein
MGRDWAGWGLATRAFQRLSQLGGAVQHGAAPVWASAPKLKHARQRLFNAWAWSETVRSWMASHPNLTFAPIGVFGVVYLLRMALVHSLQGMVGWRSLSWPVP